jgi:hypothetical protein
VGKDLPKHPEKGPQAFEKGPQAFEKGPRAPFRICRSVADFLVKELTSQGQFLSLSNPFDQPLACPFEQHLKGTLVVV